MAELGNKPHPDRSDSSEDEYDGQGITRTPDNASSVGGDNNAGPVDTGPEPPDEYPATELIRELLAYIKTYQKFGRHVNLSRQLDTRASGFYRAINQLIARFFTTPQSFEDTFKAFDASSKAIPVLERILLDCYFAEPSKVRRHTPDGDDVLDGITFIETWFADRKLLAEALDRFDSEGLRMQERPEGYGSSITADDKATLEAIAKFFKQYSGDQKVKDRDIHGRGKVNPVTDLKKAITALYEAVYAKPGHGGFLELVLKSLMLSAIPLHLLDKGRVSKKPLSVDYQNHLKNYEVWKSMINLVNSITEVATKGKFDDNLTSLKEKYESLKTLLMTVVGVHIDNLPEILKLIQLSAYIRRPFHARTAALIKALYFLDLESDKTNLVGRYDLNGLLKSLAVTLSETRSAVKDVRTTTHLKNLYDSHSGKFKEVFDVTKQCSKTLNLSTENAWSDHEAAYLSAVALDKQHLDDAAKFLSINTKA